MTLLHQQALYAALFVGGALAINAGADAPRGGIGGDQGPGIDSIRVEPAFDEAPSAAVERILNDVMARRRPLRDRHVGESRETRFPAMRHEALRIRGQTNDPLF